MLIDGHTDSGKMNTGPTYSVQDAASLAGISPSTIRLYERQGFLKLPRTAGGHRYFTEEHLDTLRRIRTLYRHGVRNRALIQKELEDSRPEPTESPSQGGQLRHPGPRLRVLRQQRGLTLREVAERSGLTHSFISTYERGLTRISYANLERLMRACNTNLLELGSEGSQGKLVRASERTSLNVNNAAILIENLTSGPAHLELQILTIAPGVASEGSYNHQGEEAIYVLSGELEVLLSEIETFSLRLGDCLHFFSSEPHRWANHGSEPAVVLWANNPPIF